MTASRVPLPPRSSSSAVIPDDVPSVACGPNESGHEFGFHDAIENAGGLAAVEQESRWQRPRKKKEDGNPKRRKRKTWEERINELVVYKEKKGNCNVPRSQGVLGNWAQDQRQFYKKGKLSQERITQLESIGFNWGTRKKNKDKPWEERFNELVVFKEKNGNCNVPRSQGVLGNWVHDQRQFYKNGKLSQERITQLESIGFNWGTRKKNEDKQWSARLNELVVYNEKNGNCNVPSKQGKLGNWVHQQRQLYKKGNLSQERTAQLEGIGFVWRSKRRRGKASTRAQSDVIVDGSHEEAGRGSIYPGTGMLNPGCPALPPLPAVQEDRDSESNALPSNSHVKKNDCATETVSM